MDPTRFDRLARYLVDPSSRRRVLRTLAGGAFVAALARVRPGAASAADDRGERGGGGRPGAAGCARLGKKCGNGKKCCGGLGCKGGKCGCQGGKKPCKGKCIPKGDCCSSADCDGRDCKDGICQPCLPGFKLCLFSCIPEDQCCNCNPPKSCQDGDCVCPSGTTECANGVCAANNTLGCCNDGDCETNFFCDNGECQCPRFVADRCVQPCDFPTGPCPGDCECRFETGGFADFCTARVDSAVCASPPCQNSSQCPFDELCVFLGEECGGSRCLAICTA